MASLGSSFSWCKRYGARRWIQKHFPRDTPGFKQKNDDYVWHPLPWVLRQTLSLPIRPAVAYNFWNKHVSNRLSPPWKNKLHPLWKKTGSDFEGDQPKATRRTPPVDMLFIEFPSKSTPWFVFFRAPGSQILFFFWWRVSNVKRHTFTLLETSKILFKGNKNLVLNMFYFLQLVFHEASGYSTIQAGCIFHGVFLSPSMVFMGFSWCNPKPSTLPCRPERSFQTYLRAAPRPLRTLGLQISYPVGK